MPCTGRETSGASLAGFAPVKAVVGPRERHPMEQLAAVLAWPSVVLIIALVAIFLFRSEVGALIGRTKKVGKGGIETFEGQPSQPTEEKKGVDEFFRSFDSPLLLEAEKLILDDLKARHIDLAGDREKTLLRALAANNILLHFERAYGSLWASQLACLRYLNSKDQGVDVAEIVPFYEAAKAAYPAWYANYSPDQWLGFLRSFNFVGDRGSVAFITVAGREFLKYLVASGKSGPFHG